MHGIRFRDSDANRPCGAAANDAARRGGRLADSSGLEGQVLRSDALNASVQQKTRETSAGIPCKAMPKKRGFGNNDPSLQDDAQAGTPLISPMATAETPATGGKDSYPTTASTPYKAMPDACSKRLRASKVPSKPRPQDHSRMAAQATVRFPVDLEEEEDPR